MHQPGHIDNVVAAKDKEKVERNRLRLKALVAAVQWLTFLLFKFCLVFHTPPILSSSSATGQEAPVGKAAGRGGDVILLQLCW